MEEIIYKLWHYQWYLIRNLIDRFGFQTKNFKRVVYEPLTTHHNEMQVRIKPMTSVVRGGKIAGRMRVG